MSVNQNKRNIIQLLESTNESDRSIALEQIRFFIKGGYIDNVIYLIDYFENNNIEQSPQAKKAHRIVNKWKRNRYQYFASR